MFKPARVKYFFAMFKPARVKYFEPTLCEIFLAMLKSWQQSHSLPCVMEYLKFKVVSNSAKGVLWGVKKTFHCSHFKLQHKERSLRLQ